MKIDEVIKQINALSQKSKKEELTEEEKETQKKLRKEYLKLFRANFENQILNLRVIDENNNDVTPQKIINKNKDKSENENK